MVLGVGYCFGCFCFCFWFWFGSRTLVDGDGGGATNPSLTTKNIANNININGNNTKNHETLLYPLEHKKFKNHVHNNAKNTLDIIAAGCTRVMAITIVIADMTKYIKAGVQRCLNIL